MQQIESFLRGDVLGSESHTLPATFYNEMILLFHRSGGSSLFVPIRSMQSMAVIDDEEVIFVDSHKRRIVELSWLKFSPRTRTSLEDSIPSEFVYYDMKVLETMKRVKMA